MKKIKKDKPPIELQRVACLQRKRVLAVLLIVVFASVAIYFAIVQIRGGFGQYTKAFTRNFSSNAEETALSAAENANYSDIFKIQRLDGYSNSTDYQKGLPDYTYANFIDTQTLEYYSTRYDYLKGKPLQMSYTYRAKVYTLDEVHFENAYAYSVRAIFSNGSIVVGQTGGSFAIRIASGFQVVNASEVNFTFRNCCVVDLELFYSEQYALLAGWASDIHQTVVVDECYEPVFVCIESSKVIS